MAVLEGHPLDLVLLEVKFRNPIGDPVEQFEAIGVGTIHFPQSERCFGRDGGSPTPAARRLRGAAEEAPQTGISFGRASYPRVC